MSKIRGFEKCSKYENVYLPMPTRKTKFSAGYDMAAAHDITIMPYRDLVSGIENEIYGLDVEEVGLGEIKDVMKRLGLKPTLVSTGYKAYMLDDEKVNLLIRSSTPLNSLIILANSDGLIDADYYNNPDNEGEIFFQLLNLSPTPIAIKKGDILGQAVFSKYLVTDEDESQEKQNRVGGFGSTNG